MHDNRDGAHSQWGKTAHRIGHAGDGGGAQRPFDRAGHPQGHREENGKFTSRKQLLKVPKLGEKAYTQCAGFLRIDGGENILDNTAVFKNDETGRQGFDAFLRSMGFEEV